MCVFALNLNFHILQIEHLSESDPPQFGQRQVFCYNFFSDAALRLFNLNFKMNIKIKTAQNRIPNMKKGGIRTSRVRFEI